MFAAAAAALAVVLVANFAVEHSDPNLAASQRYSAAVLYLSRRVVGPAIASSAPSGPSSRETALGAWCIVWQAPGVTRAPT